MKAKLILIPILLFLHATLLSQVAADIMFRDVKTKGHIKSVTEEHYDAEEETVNGKVVLKEGELSYTYYYLYNEKGKLTEEKSMFGTNRCVYNGKGYRTEEHTLHDSMWHKTCSYVINEKGQFVRDTTFDIFEPNNIYVTEYNYDNQGNNTEQIVKSTVWPGSRKIIDKYGSSGNMIEEKVIDTDGRIESVYRVEYDSRGFRLRSESYEGADSLKTSTKYTRENLGNITELIEYDSKGQRIEPYYSKRTYEYDATGNWIKQTGYGRERWYIIKRKIEYY